MSLQYFFSSKESSLLGFTGSPQHVWNIYLLRQHRHSCVYWRWGPEDYSFACTCCHNTKDRIVFQCNLSPRSRQDIVAGYCQVILVLDYFIVRNSLRNSTLDMTNGCLFCFPEMTNAKCEFIYSHEVICLFYFSLEFLLLLIYHLLSLFNLPLIYTQGTMIV